MQPAIDSLLRQSSPAELRAFLRAQGATADELAEWLCVAIAGKHRPAVETLLVEGADPNRVAPGRRRAAVHAAIEHEAPELLRIVAEHGGDVNRPDASGMTPLHLAVDVEVGSVHDDVRHAPASLTRALLELGADPEVCDATGRTPAQWADQYGHMNALELMKTRG
jgi:uncharacterized protein